MSPSRSRNSAHGDTQSNEDEIEIRTIPGVSGTAVRRSDLPNDIRSRQEALDRYREEHTRTGRMSNWALPDTHPWEAGPWEAHRIRTLGREHNDSRSNIRRDLLGYPMGSRDGSSRTSRHAARDDSAMYDWAHVCVRRTGSRPIILTIILSARPRWKLRTRLGLVFRPLPGEAAGEPLILW